jgi:glycosyltransferase involved in cell wall biosynthesis
MTTTFIIPSVGRPTLQRTIDSLLQQTNQEWKAIIIFDGIEPTIQSNDLRIEIMQIEKVGVHNHAGRVRNEGMKHVTTEWISFVDDDDIISNDYVEKLQEEIRDDIGVIVFRMKQPNGVIMPPIDNDVLRCCHVGISFSMKKKLFDDGYAFIPSHIEDFNLLQRMQQKNKIRVSPHLTYFVRPT